MAFFDKVSEALRDKTRDNLCATLQSIGVDAQMAERGLAEEGIECGMSSTSLGMIEIGKSTIHWLNVIKRERGFAGGEITYFIKYGVPDPRLRTGSPKVKIKARLKDTLFGLRKATDLQWEGKDSGLGIINRLNSDITLKNLIAKTKVNVKISAWDYPSYWIISTDPIPVGSEELWNCYQSIARHLLTEWSSG